MTDSQSIRMNRQYTDEVGVIAFRKSTDSVLHFYPKQGGGDPALNFQMLTAT